MKSSRLGVIEAGAVGLAILAWSQGAEAAGFANTRTGGEQGTPTSANPTSVLLNPGAMGFTGSWGLGLYGTLTLRSLTWKREAAPSDIKGGDAQAGNYGQAHLFNVFGGPAIAGTVRLGNLVLGGGFFAPFYGRAHWDHNASLSSTTLADGKTIATDKYPLAADGVQRWYQIDTEISVYYFAMGAAYRLGPVSIGATGNIIYTTLKDIHARNIGGSGLPDTRNESRVVTDANAVNGSFGAGAMVEVAKDQVWLGGSYQAQPGMGQQKLTGTLATVTYTSFSGSPTSSRVDKINFYETLPDVIRAGIRWHLKTAPLEFRVFGDMTRWSVMATQCASTAACSVNPNGSDAGNGVIAQNFRRNLNDSYGGRLGVSWWFDPTAEFFAGAGYETAATPDSTLSPDLADANNISGTLGGRFQITQGIFLSAGYTHQQFFNRDNRGKSTLTVSGGTPFLSPTVNQDGGGLYQQWIGYFNGNLEAMFP